MKTVFLTGATGNMGREAMKELLSRSDRFQIKILVLPHEKNKPLVQELEQKPNVTIVYGDLTNYDDVLECVTGADYVLHVGGMVAPMADYHPALTTKVNIGAAKNIVKAIQSQPNKDVIKLVYIGTVAQTGDRNPPIHWGRTGDPIKISIYDNYALTKTIAEREVIESGLKYWVSLRQTGVLYFDLMKNTNDPIMFHEPLNGVFEWVTARDSGRMLANACEDNVPEDFWCRIYNIGGGEKYRSMNWEFMQMTSSLVGVKDFRKIWEPNWFATRNFHGQWYLDSDELEKYLHFRSGSLEEFVAEMKEHAPKVAKLAKYIPSWVIKNLVFKPVANKPFGTLYWFKHHRENRITAFFGSKEQWEQIPSWEHFTFEQASKEPKKLDHGYDESKPKSELDLSDMQQAAAFRGGKCLSTEMQKGDLKTKLEWECACGHHFQASPTLVLLGGHWCPECLPMPWNYDEEAKRNPFFAQVWTPLHNPDEHNVYEASILDE
mgnify:FL=1